MSIKALTLTLILTPFFMKRMVPEFVCITFLMSLPLFWKSWEVPTLCGLGIMMDKLSASLVMLTIWTSMIMLFYKPLDKFLKLNILLLLCSLLGFFLVSSLLTFFFLFEASLIPTLCLILGWGYQPERLEASYYFVFYTISFSIPLLVALINLSLTYNEKYFYFDNLLHICSGLLGFWIMLVFMVKLPLFMVHLWLPKAHVEAPVVGSMILAGILLKTGGYGIARFFLYMKKTLPSLMFLVLGSIGMVWVCLVCLYCMDMKQLIAYSSVSHMNFMIMGLMSNSCTSYSGSVIMMISHGVCSSLLFMMIDFIYKRSNSRSIIINKGLLLMVPTLSLVWSIAVLFNMGFPPTAGSISELLIITSSSIYNGLFNILFILYLLLSAFYSVYTYMCTSHGSEFSVQMNSLEIKEIFMSVLHLVPLASLTIITKLMSMT